MRWRDESAKLKALVNDAIEYSRLIRELKKVEVLYIDDFFKVQRGQQPTPADINLAFEILNYRYANKLQTIISSEKTLDDILLIDDAVGGRIYELAKGFGMSLAYDKSKNFRLRR
jgi:DNA replication protein DnaC